MTKTLSLARYMIRSTLLAIVGSVVTSVGVVYGNHLEGLAMWGTIGYIAVFSGIMGALISSFNYRRFVAPMARIIEHIEVLAAGDLTARIDEGEVGHLTPVAASMNRMSEAWEKVLKQVNESALQTASLSQQLSASAAESTQAIHQIADAIQDVAAGAETQAKGLHESKRAIEGMAGGIQRVADSSAAVSEASAEMLQQAEQGHRSVIQAADQMDSLHSSVHHSAAVIKQLGDRSQAIGQIVEVITGIASQTNLLALNAAIEAARAGEHGRGFAVVADEVRKLAEQSEQSAGQIAELIREIQADTTRAVHTMDTGIDAVQSGRELFQAAGESFGRIVKIAQQIAGQLAEIAAVSQQMAAGSQQVCQSVEEMVGIAGRSQSSSQGMAAASREQLASVEQIAASAASLSELALELQQTVGKFKVG
ncbi:methyl-accepting chemotaxis protein [Effusibacillus pohliae]|uniref:methyl-accepting chemotaxis protein n=1 Tax=Effusibacillus pohliae TaxID=232270 RepID=UPI00037533FB|nr:methyl-accepting chemotaxis protein [Effusibacillus pohliae]